nr:immunoglobulin heavy chain junction region [Macaca mulatta]
CARIGTDYGSVYRRFDYW